jgi:TonB family protein
MKSRLFLTLIFIFIVSFAFSQEGNENKTKTDAKTKKITQKSSKKKKLKSEDFKPVESQPQVLEQPSPVYPESAQKEKIQGTIWLKIYVDENGAVKEVKTAKRTGINDEMEQSAIDAAKKTKFKPAVYEGKPTDCWVVIPYRFKLK